MSASTSASRGIPSGRGKIFELEGHPTAKLAYAWEVDGEVTTVLGEGPVESARDAVRASIMAGES